MSEQIKGLAYVEGFITAMAAVLQDREYTDGKVENITMATAEAKKMLRSVMTHIGCDENELRGLREDNKAMKEQIHNLLEYIMKELREASEPVCIPDPGAPKAKSDPLTEVNPCDAWHVQGGRTECWGVPEKPECTCGGDKNKCDYYGE